MSQVLSSVRPFSPLTVPRPTGAAADQDLVLAFINDLDHGLMLIGLDGRVAVCTSPAGRLFGLDKGHTLVGMLARHVFRHAHFGLSESRRTLWAQLKTPLRERRPVCLTLTIDGVALSLDLRPLPDKGWSVVIADATRLARRAEDAEGWRDPLTGLPNRALFAIRVREALARQQRAKEKFVILAVDLDRFKSVNDTLGHPIGDQLLCKVADRLQSTLRPTDTVARLGGDEFAILQTDARSPGDAVTLARRLVDLLGRSYLVDGHLINIGASVGLALAPEDGTDPDGLAKNADLALYAAKLAGRGTFRFFEPEMSARMDARRLLELDLRKALAMREFELVYQPQMNLATNRLVGCEALIRWHHPTRGTVSPAEFIPLAEEIGLIIPIGEWVVRTACLEAVTWPGDLSIAVNLSPAQFKSTKLVERVKAALTQSGLPPHRLELEITEGVLLQDDANNLATLHALRDLGLRISMDDFGTGYSSLSYLRSFPFDKIKIDRSFVSGAGVTDSSMAIVRAIASLGSSFGITTVAEGVETHAQMQSIRDEGCTDVQGYLISRPVSATDVMTLLNEQHSAEPHGASHHRRELEQTP